MDEQGDGLLSWCKPDWEVMKAAPRAFIITALAIGVLEFGGLYWLFHTSLEMKDDHIANLERKITTLSLNDQAKRPDTESANGQSRSGTWRRLTDSDKTKLSLMFSDGSLHKIRIYRTPAPDCIRLADDFYNFFNQKQWMQTHRPESPYDWEIPPGIYVATIPDNVSIGKIKNIKEQSGAIALIKGMESIGFPVISDH